MTVHGADTQPEVQRLRCPEGPLGEFLRAIAPPGAPALRVGLDGDYTGEGPQTPVPLTDPWTSTRHRYLRVRDNATTPVERLRAQYRANQGGDWVVEAVEAIMQPASPEMREAFAGWVATDARTSTGLPMMTPPAPLDAGMNAALVALMGQPKNSLPAYYVSAAVSVDLHASRPADNRPGRSMLGRPDARARRNRRWAGRGRVLLAEFGAWPWTHAPEGKLPTGWRHDPIFLGPLSQWRAAAHRDAAHAVVQAHRAGNAA